MLKVRYQVRLDGRSQMDKKHRDNENAIFLLNISGCEYTVLFSLGERVMYKCPMEWSMMKGEKNQITIQLDMRKRIISQNISVSK